MQQAIAQLRFLQMAPRKVRLVADTIRGLTVRQAEAQLMLRPRRAAEPLLKLLRSCVANAVGLHMQPARLFVAHITVDQGPMLKRSLPRAMGRATPLQKKMSHIVIGLREGAISEPLFTVRKKVASQKVVKKPTQRPEKQKAALSENTKPKEKAGFLKRLFSRKSV